MIQYSTVYIHTYIHTYILYTVQYSTDFFLRTQRNYIYTKNPPGFSLRYYNIVSYMIYHTAGPGSDDPKHDGSTPA